jgi:hypothetical protein
VTDTKEEVLVIPETGGEPLDHLDLVIHALEDTGGETVSCVSRETLDVHQENSWRFE